MRDVIYLLRFFCVVPPVPQLLTRTFGVITALAAVTVVSDSGRAPAALAPILLLQLFAASSGFAVPARRGRYDLLLTRGASRVLVPITHWVASVAPGVGAWLVLAAVEHVVTEGGRSSLLASGTWAAVGLVSTLPWALTVALPRFAGGIGWLLVLATVDVVLPGRVLSDWSLGLSDVGDVAWPALAFFLYPLGAVGQHLCGPRMLAVAPALVVSACAMAVACSWVVRMEVQLEAAQ